MWKNEELSSEDKQKFDAYRFTEIDNLLKLNAHSVMTIKDSEHFAKTTPENMIPTNVLDNSNLQDDGTLKAKSRCVLMGWKDPNEKPAGTCSTGTDSRSNHGDSAMVGISEGIGTSCRSNRFC